MSKKLLSEAVVRRFAKLANLPVINETGAGLTGASKGDENVDDTGKDYVQNESLYEQDAEEDIEAEVDTALPGGEEVEMGAGEEEIVDEPDLEGGDMDLGAREELAMDVIAAVADVLDIEVDIEGGEGGEGEEEFGEEEFGGEEGGLEGGETEEVEAEEEEMMMEALRGIKYVPGKKEVINEVAKRVAKRLLKAKRAEQQLQEALGNRKSQPKRRTPRRKPTRAKTPRRKTTKASRQRTRK